MPVRTDAFLPRSMAEGTIPLVAVEGTALECGREYARIILKNFPGYRDYLGHAWSWKDMNPEVKSIVAARAPYLMDLHLGIADVAGPPRGRPRDAATIGSLNDHGGCTSFAISGSLTASGHPITGQTKDVTVDRIHKYIVFRARMSDGPTILILAYPGETLGYGMWSTGMSLYRNTLFSTAGRDRDGLRGVPWGMFALACKSLSEAVDLSKEYGGRGAGNTLLADPAGNSVCIEVNAGGVDYLYAKDGISTHGNHPEGPNTRKFDGYTDQSLKDCSLFRTHGLWKRFDAERGRLTPQLVWSILMDHNGAPDAGVCRHLAAGTYDEITTGAIIAEPTLGRVHVVRGQPCSNWPATYTV
jgi:hypothetical protein